MRSVIVEGRLELCFDHTWTPVVKWDQERAYHDGIRALQTTRAVDICGIRDSDSHGALLYLIELKDFRGYRIEDKKRFSGADLPPCKECGEVQPNLYQEVALKVRDTVAGLIAAAHRRQTDSERWHPIADALTRWNRPVQVILWVDEDHVSGPARPSILIDQLKKRLGWLTSRVFVASSTHPPPGVTVRHLAG